MHKPLELTSAIADFAATLPVDGSIRDRARVVYRAMQGEGLDIRYNEETSNEWRPNGSKTAHAVLTEIDADGYRFAMCLEYTLLFLVVARHHGLTVSAFRQDTNLGENTQYIFGHIVAGVQDGGEWFVIDLANRRFYRDPAGFTRISDSALEAYHHNNSGVIYRTQQRLAEADQAISEALEKETGYGPFWYNRGCVRLVNGNAGGAETDLGQAARLQPESVHVLTNLAVAQNVQGHRRRAQETLYRARTISPTDARVAYNLGILAWQEGDLKTAETHWHDTLAIDPSHSGAHNAIRRLQAAA